MQDKLGQEPVERLTRKNLIEKYDMKTHFLMLAYGIDNGKVISIHVNTKLPEPGQIKSRMFH